jgi:hypothetical protein
LACYGGSQDRSWLPPPAARRPGTIAEAIETGPPAGGGFDATLLAWRRATAAAALQFLDTITEHQSGPGPRHR